MFLFTPAGPTWPGMRDMLAQLKGLKADTLIVTDASNREAIATNPGAVVVPAKLAARGVTPEELYSPIPYIIPAQLLTAFLAERKGLDPDRPRTLSKVTKTL